VPDKDQRRGFQGGTVAEGLQQNRGPDRDRDILSIGRQRLRERGSESREGMVEVVVR
jgi:hypothetical protein